MAPGDFAPPSALSGFGIVAEGRNLTLPRRMIRFRFQPRFEDWRALNLRAIVRQLRVLLIIASVILFCYLVLPFAHRMVGRDVGVLETYRENFGVLWLPVIVALVLGGSYVAVRRRWQSVEELRVEKEYEIDEAGVRVTGASLNGFLEWKHFHSADYTRGCFFLKTHQNQFHYFPESVVPGRRAFLDLVARHIRVSKRWKKEQRRS